MIQPIVIKIHQHAERTDVTMLELHGQLDSVSAGQVEKTLDELVEKKMYRIVIDLHDVNYVSSAGWGIFLGILKEVKSSNGDIKLAGLTDEVNDVFQLLELDNFLPTYKTSKEAILSFK
ncbi:STAS domain-containing protein [bacterium]|nr:STAS domain-containing protein [bacterium]